MKTRQLLLVISGFLTLFLASSLPFDDPVWHHVHLRVPDLGEGAKWYSKYMEGEARRTSAGFGETTINFFRAEGEFKGSSGSSVDHIGWSFRDLDAKMKEFGEAGIRILSQPRSIGSIKYAYIEDQWGTKIEVLQDAGHLGFHHVHIYTTDPGTTRDWYKDVFGGRTISYLGSITALDYGAAKLFFRGQARITKIAPTEGRSLDHIGFSVANLDTAAAKIKEKGVIFTEEPRTLRGTLKISYLEGPDGVRIEILQLGS